MPRSSTKKTPAKKRMVSPNVSKKTHLCDDENACSPSGMLGLPGSFMYDFVTKICVTLFIILLVYLLLFLGSSIRNSLKSYGVIGEYAQKERVISLEAVGVAEVLPNIAETTMGLRSEAPTVAQAQEKNTRIANVLVKKLTEKGIAKDDIKTEQYAVYPVYDYTRDEGRILRGYEASQRVRIKIRDLEKTKHILALAGDVGVDSVGEISFTVDDTAAYVEQARDRALQNMAKKITHIQNSLGVRVQHVASYKEFEYGQNVYEQFGARRVYLDDSDAIGGSDAEAVEPGTSTVELKIMATFAIQ